jgi:hypothetical protein
MLQTKDLWNYKQILLALKNANGAVSLATAFIKENNFKLTTYFVAMTNRDRSFVAVLEDPENSRVDLKPLHNKLAKLQRYSTLELVRGMFDTFTFGDLNAMGIGATSDAALLEAVQHFIFSEVKQLETDRLLASPNTMSLVYNYCIEGRIDFTVAQRILLSEFFKKPTKSIVELANMPYVSTNMGNYLNCKHIGAGG